MILDEMLKNSSLSANELKQLSLIGQLLNLTPNANGLTDESSQEDVITLSIEAFKNLNILGDDDEKFINTIKKSIIPLNVGGHTFSVYIPSDENVKEFYIIDTAQLSPNTYKKFSVNPTQKFDTLISKFKPFTDTNIPPFEVHEEISKMKGIKKDDKFNIVNNKTMLVGNCYIISVFDTLMFAVHTYKTNKKQISKANQLEVSFKNTFNTEEHTILEEIKKNILGKLGQNSSERFKECVNELWSIYLYNKFINDKDPTADEFLKKVRFHNLSENKIKTLPKEIQSLFNHYKNLDEIINTDTNFPESIINYIKQHNIENIDFSRDNFLNFEFQILLGEIYSNIADYYRSEENCPMAIEYYNKAINLNACVPTDYCNLATLLFSTERYDEAITLLEKSVALNPNNPIYYYILGFTYFDNKNFDGAITNLEKSKNLKFHDPVKIDTVLEECYSEKGMLIIDKYYSSNLYKVNQNFIESFCENKQNDALNAIIQLNEIYKKSDMKIAFDIELIKKNDTTFLKTLPEEANDFVIKIKKAFDNIPKDKQILRGRVL